MSTLVVTCRPLMREYLKLLRFLRGHVRMLLVAAALMLISTLFEGFQLSLAVPITDKILSKNKIILPPQAPDFLHGWVTHINAMEPLVLLRLISIIILAMLLLKGLFTFWSGYLMNDLSQRIMRDIRSQLYEKIQNLSLDYFGKKRSGELISRITNDVQVIENAVSYGVTDLFRQTFTIIMFVAKVS